MWTWCFHWRNGGLCNLFSVALSTDCRHVWYTSLRQRSHGIVNTIQWRVSSKRPAQLVLNCCTDGGTSSSSSSTRGSAVAYLDSLSSSPRSRLLVFSNNTDNYSNCNTEQFHNTLMAAHHATRRSCSRVEKGIAGQCFYQHGRVQTPVDVVETTQYIVLVFLIRPCTPAGMGKRGYLPPPLEILWSVFVH